MVLTLARRVLSRCRFTPAAYLCLLVNNTHTLVQSQKWPLQASFPTGPLVMSANIMQKSNFCISDQGFSEVTFEELQKLLNDKSVVLMDVREPKELADDGKIPGSINVPLADVESVLKLQPDKFAAKYGASLPSKDDSENLIMTCRSGKRATTACNTARTLGFQDVRCYCGSFLDWVEKGGTVEKS